jgi:hypothetical protein
MTGKAQQSGSEFGIFHAGRGVFQDICALWA